MKPSKLVVRYIEMALRERLAETYSSDKVIEDVVAASMPGLHVSKETLYHAIELAATIKKEDI